MLALILIVILISFVGIILKMGLLIGAGVVENKQQQKTNADIDGAKVAWDERVRELGINLKECTYVLFYTDSTMVSGRYVYLWYDGNKVRGFNSLNYIGMAIPANPRKWHIFSYNKGDIIDVQQKPDCCILSFSFMHQYCDAKDYGKLAAFVSRVKSS